MADVRRIYPEAKTALINWIEEHFHDIESYAFTCLLKDGKTVTVYDVSSRVEALGLLEVAKSGEFKPREE